MPQLRKLFEGFQSDQVNTDPLQRNYIVCFQEFVRNWDRGFWKKSLVNNYDRAVKQRGKITAELVSRLFLIPESTERDWKIACTVLQWLGTTDGQNYLRSLK